MLKMAVPEMHKNSDANAHTQLQNNTSVSRIGFPNILVEDIWVWIHHFMAKISRRAKMSRLRHDLLVPGLDV